MKREDLLKYEIASSLLSWLPQFGFITYISASYLVWKVDRKLKAYNDFLEKEAEAGK